MLVFQMFKHSSLSAFECLASLGSIPHNPAPTRQGAVMRHLAAILFLIAATTAFAEVVETVDETLGTGEVMAFGLNTYLVFLEISELTEDAPSWVLGASGLVVSAATLALKDYDGTLFSAFQTGMASANLLMGGYLVLKADHAGRHAFRIRPHVQSVEGCTAWGCALSVRF